MSTEINKDDYPDVMVDLETTGTDFGHCAIIQISAVRFNLREKLVAPDFFDRCLMIPQDRFWQEGGREFWIKRKELYGKIQSRMEDPLAVLRAFSEWVGGDGKNRVLWAKPSHFESPFLQNYFTRFDVRNPFFYRTTTDLNSFFRGLYYPDPVPDFERTLEFVGELHNGLHDTLHQLKVLFHTIADAETKFGRIEVPQEVA